MSRATLVLAASALDWAAGDPECLPHPVRLIGAAIDRGEKLLHPGGARARSSDDALSSAAGSTSLHEFAAGLILTSTITVAAYLAPRALKLLPRSVGTLLGIALAATTLAARNLDDEARAVLAALDRHNLPLARMRLSRIVGRDTAMLDQPAICRALIETLAESLSDGVVAPMFYLAVGGLPAAMAFKAVSTLDSMIGHRTPRYLYFGRPAARFDDVLNFIPARLSAAAILAFCPQAAPVFLRDRHAHASPNAGHPEAAIAGVLGVQLGGSSSYAGEPHAAPLLNAGSSLPTPRDARRALRITRAVSVVAALLAAALSAVLPALASRRRL